MSVKANICYLCCNEIDYEKDEISPDHIPPKQFYPKEYRKANELQLLKINVHDKCNKSYQKDEDYFFNSIGPLALGSDTGALILNDLFEKFKKRKSNRVLGEMILNEFVERPLNLILPNNLIGKKYNTHRINRIIWKIVRGLFYFQFKSCIPIDSRHSCKIYPPIYEPPNEFIEILISNKTIINPEILIYGYQIIKSADVPEHIKRDIKDDHESICSWALLLWERIPIYCVFLK